MESGRRALAIWASRSLHVDFCDCERVIERGSQTPHVPKIEQIPRVKIAPLRLGFGHLGLRFLHADLYADGRVLVSRCAF